MSQFISLRILASLSKKAKGLMTPKAPPVADRATETAGPREEPSSASRISVNRIRVQG